MKAKVLFIGLKPVNGKGLDGVSKVALHLTRQNDDYDATFASLSDHGTEVKKTKLGSLLSAYPFNIIPAKRLKGALASLRPLMDSHDAVVIFAVDIAPLLLLVDDKLRRKIVLFPIDSLAMFFSRRCAAEANPFKKMIWAWECMKASFWEKKIYSLAEKVIFVSQVDADFSKRLTGQDKFFQVPLCVALEEFFPRPLEKKYDFIFTGNYNYSPNQGAYAFIKDFLAPAFPEQTFAFVGANIHFLEQGTGKNVELVGRVDDLNGELNCSRLFLAPIFFGAGMKNKVLEAMACGMVVIGSSIAFDSIPVTDGVDAFVVEGEGHADWITKIEDVLRRASEYSTIGERARVMVRDNFVWDAARSKLKKLLPERSMDGHA